MREFDAIYERQVQQVFGFFAYLLNSREDAEDLTQQTFERALRAWDRFDATRGTASAWLMAIARNLFVDHMRARTRQPARAEADWQELTASPDRHAVGLEPDIERALLALSQRERELIALRFGADLTGAEIAELTGLSIANVQQILARSLRRMRASLDAVASAAA